MLRVACCVVIKLFSLDWLTQQQRIINDFNIYSFIFFVVFKLSDMSCKRDSVSNQLADYCKHADKK